jgi:hypothetical protein
MKILLDKHFSPKSMYLLTLNLNISFYLQFLPEGQENLPSDAAIFASILIFYSIPNQFHLNFRTPYFKYEIMPEGTLTLALRAIEPTPPWEELMR